MTNGIDNLVEMKVVIPFNNSIERLCHGQEEIYGIDNLRQWDREGRRKCGKKNEDQCMRIVEDSVGIL